MERFRQVIKVIAIVTAAVAIFGYFMAIWHTLNRNPEGFAEHIAYSLVAIIVAVTLMNSIDA